MGNMNGPDWLIKPSSDEMFSLNNTSRWKTESKSSEEYFSYIAPHAKYYFSPLNHISLFTVKNLAALSYFNKVLVRDGLLSLKLFFLRNPDPQGLKTKLIVHKSFGQFIPDRWKENIIFYQFKLMNKEEDSKKRLILILHPDEKHCPNSFLEKKLTQYDLARYEEIKCLITEPKTLESSGFTQKDHFEKIKTILKVTNNNCEVTTLDEITPKDISESAYLEINPFNYLYADCYIRWFFLFHGATPLDSNLFQTHPENSFDFKVSPHHAISVFLDTRLDTKQNLSIQEERNIFLLDLLDADEHSVNLCSNGFKDYVSSLLNENSNYY